MTKACEGDNAGCFAAGTKLWTPDGYRAVETIREGDLVFSQDQFRPDGPIAAKPVEKVFRRLAEVQHLHLRGPNGFIATIRTVGEHPFFAHGRGWTATKDLTTEDWVLTDTGDWAKVEEVYSTGELESVYNLRVADWHTYFVGEQEWGWHAWAHNTTNCAPPTVGRTGPVITYKGDHRSLDVVFAIGLQTWAETTKATPNWSVEDHVDGKILGPKSSTSTADSGYVATCPDITGAKVWGSYMYEIYLPDGIDVDKYWKVTHGKSRYGLFANEAEVLGIGNIPSSQIKGAYKKVTIQPSEVNCHR